MENIETDLLQHRVHEVFFQFDDEEPIKMAYVIGGDEFSLTLKGGETGEPSIVFTDGKGKEFKIFMKIEK